MADKKISELTNISGVDVADGDRFAIVDTSETETKSIYMSELRVAVGANFSIGAQTAPTSATDTGSVGQIVWDANYIYVCVATDTWKRVAIASW